MNQGFALNLSVGIIAAVASVWALHWASAVFIPLCLAILLSSTFAPLVDRIQRLGTGRAGSVTIVMMLMIVAVGLTGWAVSADVKQIVRDLPDYERRLVARVTAMGADVSSPLYPLWRRLQANPSRTATNPATKSGGVATPLAYFTPWLATSAVSIIASICLVVGLTSTLLLRKEDVRDRFLRLLGIGQITRSTPMLDEASRAIGKYLFWQAMLNLTFGVIFGAALFFVGIPYAFTWGLLAAILRFIPYVGAWIAATPPTLLAAALFDNWFGLLAVLAITIGLTYVYGAWVERYFVVRATGLSPLALVVAAAFWTWLWGPVGLVLSTPISVCMVALGRRIESFELLDVILGNETEFQPSFRFYQRLVARDEGNAIDIVEAYLKTHSPEEFGDQVLVPTLERLEHDVARGAIGAQEAQEMARRCEQVLVEVLGPPPTTSEQGTTTAIAYAARGTIDRPIMLLAVRLLSSTVEVEVVDVGAVVAELVDRVARERPKVVVICAAAETGLSQVRYVLKRLNALDSTPNVVVLFYAAEDRLDELDARVKEWRAAATAHSLTELQQRVQTYVALDPNPKANKAT